MGVLPGAEVGMVADRQVLAALRATRPFRHVRVQDLADLDGLVAWKSFAAGDMVARKGSTARSAWVVADGRVRLGAKDDPAARHLAPGDTVDETIAMTGGVRPASIRAEEAATLLEVSTEGLAHLVATNPRIAVEITSSRRRPTREPTVAVATLDPERSTTADVDAQPGAQLRTAALLAWHSLLHRRARVITTLASVAMIFTMVLLITGMAQQFRLEPRIAIESLGGDSWIVGPDATGVFTSAATLPRAVVEEVGALAAADQIHPIVAARAAIVDGDGTLDVILIGHEPGGLGAPVIRAGVAARADELVASAALDVDLGDTLQLGPAPLRVAGRSDEITLFAGLPFVWMPLAQAQQIVYNGQPTVTALLVSGDAPTGDGWSVLTNDEVIDDAMRPLERAFSSVIVMSVLLWIVAGLVIGAVAYVTALERTRDFAVIKAIGGSDATLLASLMFQSLFTALAAAGVAAILQAFTTPIFPLAITVPTSALWQLPIVAAIVAVVASVAGIRRVRTIDPSAAFGAAT